ncbi:formimidoylglutamase [Candidatus Sulfidibacterium hydrothermale]|uniref:formimidoylglutamase n=1 Tax=Candidatus Sulfidibacterium hydrothermale TaxID=2875962 RepID=UPI001F0A15A7|nr:formimidoylglutamase [Candidatus Sulfidibacterium hydrothermale]UBM63025.1 formimidoylglutamase [Candidatus Sulfidibacterium hydrothermale]
MTDFEHLYKPAQKEIWTGRVDDLHDPDAYRWHQLMQFLDLRKPLQKERKLSFCFLGFKSDEGVKRNLGRPGAKQGPDSIRKQLANLPSYFNSDVNLFDAGNILCENNLEQSQELLAEAVYKLLQAEMFPVLLGGGHEIAFGHYLGLHRFFKERGEPLPAIVNLDAHFDLRPWHNGISSGTMFSQIADMNRKNGEPFRYLVLGIQQSANTKSLFNRANHLGAQYVLCKAMRNKPLEDTFHKIDAFAKGGKTYLTVCTDVFSSAIAPGVSAPQPFGMFPETGLRLIKHVARNTHLVSFDIAEVAPRFDDDEQTAKLASVLIFALLNTLYKPDVNLIL